MQMPGRKGQLSGGEYRYAFNGMETDKEVSGQGNSYTTQFRQYDPRLGRWKSLDPLAGKFSGMSPFVAFNNNPIVYTDPLGLEGKEPSTGGNGAPKEKGGDEVIQVENENGVWVWNPESQTWIGSSNTVETKAGSSSNNSGVKPEPIAVDNTKVIVNKNYPSVNSDSGNESSSLEELGNMLDSWLRSLMGNAEASFGVEFVTNDNRTNPNSLPPMRLSVDGWSIEINIDDLEELIDIISLAYPAVPKPKVIKPKYTRAQYRNKKYIEYDKNKMYKGLGPKTMSTKKKAADAAYDKYLKDIANKNKANFEKWVNDIKDELSPMNGADDIVRQIRDGGTGYGDQSGGYGKTGGQKSVIVIQHSSGSYMYSNGIWFHRMACTSCPTEYNDEGKAYKDSTYQKINESDVPKSILKKVK